MLRVKINFDLLDQSKLFPGKKGRYLDLALIETKGNKYGDDYMVVQDLGKEARERGEKGPILGNARVIRAQGAQTAPAHKAAQEPENDGQNVPF